LIGDTSDVYKGLLRGEIVGSDDEDDGIRELKRMVGESANVSASAVFASAVFASAVFASAVFAGAVFNDGERATSLDAIFEIWIEDFGEGRVVVVRRERFTPVL